MTPTVVVCFKCLKANRIQIGTRFYEITAWFRCGNCCQANSVKIISSPLDIPDTVDIQTGEEA